MSEIKNTEKVSVTDNNKKSVETKEVNGRLDARSKDYVQNNEKKRFTYGVSGEGLKKEVTPERKLENKEQNLKRESEKQLGNKSEKQEAKREENPQKQLENKSEKQEAKREENPQKQLENKSEKQEAKREENPQKKASKMGGDLVNKFQREDEVGKAAGRSGGHGKPYKLAGAELIRQANKLPKNDPMREALKKEGNRLVNKGKEIDHPYRRH
ncbi:hypothetical protein [Methanosarcina mazei]|uniref:Uncharacterized protein n=1 Tax=Methanosarcina mazei TaxID=2209 RepID=A0A0F8G7N5_METMZ|nr:hypothetical protein [Methanosarcina mazei]KKG50724.1 hypothetical protein DU33_19855 [Methanosarcina mazei]KKG96770.1 hypothetical protein DU66_00990 [Methanosarcina mazei]